MKKKKTQQNMIVSIIIILLALAIIIVSYHVIIYLLGPQFTIYKEECVNETGKLIYEWGNCSDESFGEGKGYHQELDYWMVYHSSDKCEWDLYYEEKQVCEKAEVDEILLKKLIITFKIMDAKDCKSSSILEGCFLNVTYKIEKSWWEENQEEFIKDYTSYEITEEIENKISKQDLTPELLEQNCEEEDYNMDCDLVGNTMDCEKADKIYKCGEYFVEVR